MDKMMHPKEQQRRAMDAAIESWFHRHFHNVNKGTALYASLEIAKNDLKKTLGFDRFSKGETS